MSKALTRIIVNAIVMMTRKVVKGAMNMPLRNQLKEHRSRMRINQTELGKLAGVSRQTISLIERGDITVSGAGIEAGEDLWSSGRRHISV